MNKYCLAGLGILILCVAGCGERKSEEIQAAVVDKAQMDFMAQGVKYLKESNVRGAVKSFDEAIKQNPKDLRPYLILGETYMHAGQYDRAVDTLTAASYVDPDQGEVYYLLAMSQGLAGHVPEAKINAQKSVIAFEKQKDVPNLKKAMVLLQGLVKTQ